MFSCCSGEEMMELSPNTTPIVLQGGQKGGHLAVSCCSTERNRGLQNLYSAVRSRPAPPISSRHFNHLARRRKGIIGPQIGRREIEVRQKVGQKSDKKSDKTPRSVRFSQSSLPRLVGTPEACALLPRAGLSPARLRSGGYPPHSTFPKPTPRRFLSRAPVRARGALPHSIFYKDLHRKGVYLN